MLRLLIKDITVEKRSEPAQALLHIRWQGGACTDLAVGLPLPMAERLRTPAAVVERVRDLANSMRDPQIADQLNRDGLVSATGRPYTKARVQWIRWRYNIPAASTIDRAGEMSVAQVARHFAIKAGVVYYWIAHGIIEPRRPNGGTRCWITLDAAKEQELRDWVRNSRRIQRTTQQS